VKDSKDVSKDDVESLVQVDDIPDEEIMLPVDMKAVGEPFEDIEQMLAKLGPKKTAESFLKARELFESNPDKEDEAERPKSMTAQEWREVLEEDGMEGFEGEEEEFDGLLDFDEEGEEEFDDIDDEEGEDEDQDELESPEPAKKKAKTG